MTRRWRKEAAPCSGSPFGNTRQTLRKRWDRGFESISLQRRVSCEPEADTVMVGNFCFRPQSRPGERRAVGAGHPIPQAVWEWVSRIIAAMPIIWPEWDRQDLAVSIARLPGAHGSAESLPMPLPQRLLPLVPVTQWVD